MAHRPEWFPAANIDSPCSSILRISVDVVGYIRGSYDCMPEHHALNIKALQWVVKNWDYNYDCGRSGDSLFDNTILKLVKTALTMEEIDKDRRGY
jgi:hypothetical protein